MYVCFGARPEITVKIFNSKTEETINWISAESDNEYQYIQKASIVKLEKMLNTEGFRKEDSKQAELVVYSIPM